MTFTRRHFLKSAAAISLGFTGLRRNVAAAAGISAGYGPLLPAGEFLDLPEGFSYRVLSRTGDAMSDGLLVPGLPDAMAAFAGPEGRTLLVCNHELKAGSLAAGAFGERNERVASLGSEWFYDYGKGAPALGGTSTLVIGPTGEVERHYLSLAGTIRNCAGGPTPWGSWVTCEETMQVADEDHEKDHGYNFEVPASVQIQRARPLPLRQMGRFRHEAVAVDPVSGIVYQTEDKTDSLIYRYIPREPGKLAAGGRLQALAVIDKPSLDTRNWEDEAGLQVGSEDRLPISWIDMDNVESPADDLRHQGFANGAARFARGEGMWYGNDAIYFACTSGGPAKKGQVWRYQPGLHEGTAEEAPGTLELFLEPNDADLVDKCDNLTVAPWGDVILCEDGPEDDFLIGVTPEGELYRLGRNAYNKSEFAGSVFSPDGLELYVNIQSPGITLAIRGPWKRAI
jgi:secreted PhoX family phosphatase